MDLAQRDLTDLQGYIRFLARKPQPQPDPVYSGRTYARTGARDNKAMLASKSTENLSSRSATLSAKSSEDFSGKSAAVGAKSTDNLSNRSTGLSALRLHQHGHKIAPHRQ